MSKQRKRGRTVSHRSANAASGDELRAGSTPAASANGGLGEVAKPAVSKTADGESLSRCESEALRQNETLAAAGEMQRKISVGENGGKKRRRYNVEKFLSHPQFCSLGSITNIDKAKYDANFEAIFGAKPPPADFGQREGYTVKPYTGRHEAILIGDEEITDDERKALKAKMLKRLMRAAKR